MTTNEPIDVGPAAGGHLPASDSDRHQVIMLLNAAHAEGRITAEEHRGRVAAAAQAQVFDDLIPLTRDLMPSHPVQRYVASGPVPTPQRGIEVDAAGANPATDVMVAIFGGVERKGRWRLRRSSLVFCLFGGVELDLTDAVLEGDRVELNVFCVFGGVDIKAPHGIHVDNNVIGIFGGSDVKNLDQDLGGPGIAARGLCLFGGLDIRGDRRTSQAHSERQLRREQARRERAERRAFERQLKQDRRGR